MKQLFVWVRRADGAIQLAGELVTTEPLPHNGRFESEFEYTPAWASDPEAFTLDPVSLPLDRSGRRFRADLFYPPLAIFDDALPDDWGRRLLAAALRQEGHKPTPAEMLLRMGGGGTGALLFTDTPAVPQPYATLTSAALPTLLSAAAQFEQGTLPFNDDFRRLLEGSSRAGGARPKALVHDDAGEWLVKFPSRARDGAYDVIGLEATCLTLARRAGLEVPEARLQMLGRRRVLMVRRFDVTAQNGRLHMISLSTLCKERPGVYARDYSDIAEVLRKHSAAPAADVAALFRQMVFNAAIGNVDDHLKNFWMLAMPGGYRLSPAFDLVPDVTGRGTHTLAFRFGSECPKRADLVELADMWGASQPTGIIDEVVKAVGAFAAMARKLDVRGTRTLETICADVRRRVQIIAHSE